MQHILSILESGDTNRIKELDERGLDKLINTTNFLLESNTSLIPHTTLKEFKNTIDNKILQERTMNMEPSIKFSLDDDGNILITKHESADFNTIYHNSHILLKEYEKIDNIESMKYELCKIYMMVSIINEKYIHNPGILVSKYKQADMAKLKSFIMNDFYKYLRIISEKEKGFNFNKYYSNTQFGIETYKIDNRVIKGLKQILF
jgi:hypothetical protein